VLNHPWFAEFADIHKLREGAQGGEAKFKAYTLTEPNSRRSKRKWKSMDISECKLIIMMIIIINSY
jgi:hypothetical protein